MGGGSGLTHPLSPTFPTQFNTNVEAFPKGMITQPLLSVRVPLKGSLQ